MNIKYKLKKIKSLIFNEDGATMIEYGLIVSIVALAIATMLSSFGGTVNNTFNTVGTTIEDSRN